MITGSAEVEHQIRRGWPRQRATCREWASALAGPKVGQWASARPRAALPKTRWRGRRCQVLARPRSRSLAAPVAGGPLAAASRVHDPRWSRAKRGAAPQPSQPCRRASRSRFAAPRGQWPAPWFTPRHLHSHAGPIDARHLALHSWRCRPGLVSSYTRWSFTRPSQHETNSAVGFEPWSAVR